MPLPVIGGVFRCALIWQNTDLARNAVNVMHFLKTGSTPAALATAMEAHVTADMWACCDTNSKIVQLNITPLDGSSTSLAYTTSGGSKWAGEDTAEDVNPQVAAIVKMTTLQRGRSYRGRIFLPWVSEGKQTNGKLVTGVQTLMQSAWATWYAAMVTDGFQPVVASYKLSTAANITTLHVSASTATQRRRQKRLSS